MYTISVYIHVIILHQSLIFITSILSFLLGTYKTFTARNLNNIVLTKLLSNIHYLSKLKQGITKYIFSQRFQEKGYAVSQKFFLL